MPKFEVYASVTQLHKVVVNAKSKSEAEELARELTCEDTCYETDNFEIGGVVKVR